MKLIKDLGMCKINPNTGATIIKATRFGIYKCPTCKTEFITLTKNVLNGRTNGCKPCGYKTNHSKYNTIGNATTDPIYCKWVGMRHRCNSDKNSGYTRYGARGITVCDTWNDFNVFKEWAINNGYSHELTIDRIDNNKGYSPDNCRFTTRHIQAHNQRAIRTSNTTGYKGVYWSKQKQKFCAQVMYKNKKYHIGFFDDALEAAKAHDTYVLTMGFCNTTNGVL